MTITVITGAATGIGRAVRNQLETEGDTVIGIDIKETEIIADLSTIEGRKDAIEKTRKKTGGKIDKLVLAAGLGGVAPNGLMVLNLNYYGTFELVDALRPMMLGQPGASIVCISSNASQFGVDYDDPVVMALLENDEEKSTAAFKDQDPGTGYRLSKHAVARAVRHRAVAWGPQGPRINAVVPGKTETPMLQAVLNDPEMSQFVDLIPLPLKRSAKPEEISEVVCFALSDKASFVHGSVLWADGGCDAAVRPDLF